MSTPRIKTIAGVGSVCFAPSPRARRVSISVRPPGRIRVAVPPGVSLRQAEAFVLNKRAWIQKHLERMRQEAAGSPDRLQERAAPDSETRAMLRHRVKELAGLYGFTYNRIFIRCQRTRWGSCSGKNNLNLNLKLASLPEMLRDYVILHELMHTRIKNHGKNFWQELDKYVGDARGLRDRLNRIPLDDKPPPHA
ncbi:MAG: M48 family metallopeptidase [Candidatus Aminicenantaceae bacterium]